MPACTEKIFTNVKLMFRIDIKNTISCLNPHYNTESDNDSEDEEEHPLTLPVMQQDDINKGKTEAIPPKEQVFAVLRDQRMNVSKRAFLKRKAIEPSRETKFMRNFVSYEAQVDEALLEVMTDSSKERP